MTDSTHSDQAALHRAARAQTILTDPMVQDALAFVRDQVRDAFFDLELTDPGARERLLLMDRARQQFERVFTAHLMDGSVARAQLLSDDLAAQHLAAIQQRVKER